MYLPSAFEDKMKRLLGKEYDSYIDCYGQPRWYGLRVNTNKITTEEFKGICPFEIRPIPWIANGFYYDGTQVSPAKHPYYAAGLYYLQEPSAMTPASRLPVCPGDKVLDLCAAPGGKSTELGAGLYGQGMLVANDISNSRAKGLLKNIEVFGIGNVLVLSEEPGKLVNYFPEYFDKILIDAPCSGEGMFRKEKKMIRAWEEHGPDYFSVIQRNILNKAAEMLKAGGLLLYSTCTFDPDENEGAIEALLNEHPEFEICSIAGYEGFASGLPEVTAGRNPDLSKTIRIWPHKMQGEGHYVALLKKRSSQTQAAQVTSRASHKERELPDELKQFLARVSRSFDPLRMEFHGERVYYMPTEVPDLRGIRFLRTGLLLGELKKNRFEPSQALAMNLKMEEFKDVLNLSVCDNRVVKYLKGETLEIMEAQDKEKGWRLVCVDGFPLGWGKISAGRLKNKYLPGWRW